MSSLELLQQLLAVSIQPDVPLADHQIDLVNQQSHLSVVHWRNQTSFGETMPAQLLDYHSQPAVLLSYHSAFLSLYSVVKSYLSQKAHFHVIP